MYSTMFVVGKGGVVRDAAHHRSVLSRVARFAVLYESGGDVICYCLLDSTPADVTVTTGNTLTISTPSGIFTLA